MHINTISHRYFCNNFMLKFETFIKSLLDGNSYNVNLLRIPSKVELSYLYWTSTTLDWRACLTAVVFRSLLEMITSRNGRSWISASWLPAPVSAMSTASSWYEMTTSSSLPRESPEPREATEPLLLISCVSDVLLRKPRILHCNEF